MSITRGTRFGPYEIAALIGVGGMGEVYRATDTNLKRDVALKFLPENFVTDATRLARLQREAEVLAALNHPNVAQIFGIERAASDGRTALVMELIDGPTLAERIGQGALPPPEALAVALQIVAALEAAHERGIVHRDLKPANIKLKPDGTVKVLDFGIAKALDARTASGPPPVALTTPAMTEAGVVLGTAAYMSPEQARGKAVDRRADIWAFGCVLYEMLVGEAAFLGDDVTTTLARVLEREPDLRRLPAGVPPSVRGTLELCLQKDPKKRLRDIGDVRLALEGGLASMSNAPARAPLWRRALPAAAALAVGVLGAAAYFATSSRPAPLATQAPAAAITRFTFTPPATAPLSNLSGLDLAISPDGKRVAYFSESPETGGVSLWVRELDALEARPIPGTATSAGTGALNPFFSRDGRSVAFRSERDVIRVSIDGGPPIKIMDAPTVAFIGGDWNADDTIIYSAGRALYRVSAGGGGTPQRLTKDTEGASFIASPRLLPGGHAVLYTQVENGAERTAVLDLDTGEQKTVLDGAQDAVYSATGHIVFARGTTLMAAPFDTKELAVTGEPVALIQDVRHPSVQNASDFALSASGTLAYVPSGGEQAAGSSVVWVDRAGKVVGRAVNEPVDTPRDPALSPDGTRLLLSTGTVGGGDVWAYDLRGRPPIRLAVIGDDRSAVWSPDGKRIVFTQITNGAHLYSVLADGSMVTPEPLREQPVAGMVRTWSAAGDLLMAALPIATGDILVMRASGNDTPRPLVATEYIEADPALSPNGRWLAYVSNRTGRPEIWVQGYPEGPVVRVSNNGGYEPRWSADGRELFYFSGNAMMAVKMQTADEPSFDAPVQLFVGRFLLTTNTGAASYDVARDGRFLMIEPPGANDRPALASIVVAQNWAEELKKRVPKK